jgi:ribosomal protein L37AE/L43A
MPIQDQHLNSTQIGGIVAVDKISSYLACRKCNKTIDATNTAILQCHACNRIHKASARSVQWYAHVLFQTNDR